MKRLSSSRLEDTRSTRGASLSLPFFWRPCRWGRYFKLPPSLAFYHHFPDTVPVLSSCLEAEWNLIENYRWKMSNLGFLGISIEWVVFWMLVEDCGRRKEEFGIFIWMERWRNCKKKYIEFEYRILEWLLNNKLL